MLRESDARTLDDWVVAVGTPAEECAALLPWVAKEDRDLVIRGFEATYEKAANSWEADPFDPSTYAVVLDCARFLGDHRFIRLYA